MKDKSKPFLSKRSSALLITLAMFWIFGVTAYAADCNCGGCCSRRGGVVCSGGVTKCADGTSLSSTCRNKGCAAEGCPGCGGAAIKTKVQSSTTTTVVKTKARPSTTTTVVKTKVHLSTTTTVIITSTTTTTAVQPTSTSTTVTTLPAHQ